MNVNWEWIKILNEERPCLYPSINITRGSNPRRLRWAEQIARVEEYNSALKTIIHNYI
jgi:hypothetical protein